MAGFVRLGNPLSISIAFTLYSLINAAVMFGGALFIGGKVGISFGEPLTAVLKFVGIAFFVGMITTLIDAKMGMLGMFVLSLAVSAVLYTILFVYLFNMDVEDSIWMVCFFIGVRTALSWLLLPILLGMLSSGVTLGMGGGKPTLTDAQQKLAQRIEDNTDLGLVEEAREFIKAGRQAFWGDMVNAAYDAGAEHVGFCVVRDINGKPDPYSIVVKMPDDPQKRAAIMKVINDTLQARAPADDKPAPVLDPGGEYFELPV